MFSPSSGNSGIPITMEETRKESVTVRAAGQGGG